MAINPMQKKARNSMLIGIILGLLIGAVVCVLLYLRLSKLQEELEKREAATKKVWVLAQDVKSGQKIDLSMFQEKQVLQDVIPSDFITVADLEEDTISKLDMTKGTVVSKAQIQKSTQKVTADLRLQEYNMIVLPQQLNFGQYIDIRLRLPNGQDYIIVSKKEIQNVTEDTIWINMYEEETLAMSNAIVEAYKMTGAKLYATTYVEPGNQVDAIPTYKPSVEVINLINANPNIKEEARLKLKARYTDEITARRNQDINGQLSIYAEEALDNVESNVEEEITNSKESRKEYLDSLNASTVQ